MAPALHVRCGCRGAGCHGVSCNTERRRRWWRRRWRRQWRCVQTRVESATTALTPCAGGAGSGGGSGRHGDGEDSSLPPRDSSFWFSVESFVRRNPSRASAAAVATLGVASFAFSRSEFGVAMKMRKVFEEGGLRGWEKHFRKDQGPNCLPRTELLKDMSELLRPGKLPQYTVIVGAAGTGKSAGHTPPGVFVALTNRTFAGKSTAVRKAIVGLKKPKGVVYFLPPTLLSGFSSALADALGYRRPVAWADRVVRLFTGETKEQAGMPPTTSEPHATWHALEPCIVKAAELYTSKHGVPPVLVLDGMDLVAKENPEFFVTMQNFAKKCADTGTLSVMLVFSDGRALPLLQSSSAITRAGVICEVGDISDEEARSLLRNTYSVKDVDRAAALVDQVAGGRFPLLIKCGLSSKSLDAISRELDIKTRDSLRKVGVRATEPLFCKLLSSSCIDMDTAHELLPESKVQELLRLNILLAHPDGTYSFHDRHVTRFMQRAGRT